MPVWISKLSDVSPSLSLSLSLSPSLSGGDTCCRCQEHCLAPLSPNSTRAPSECGGSLGSPLSLRGRTPEAGLGSTRDVGEREGGHSCYMRWAWLIFDCLLPNERSVTNPDRPVAFYRAGCTDSQPLRLGSFRDHFRPRNELPSSSAVDFS